MSNCSLRAVDFEADISIYLGYILFRVEFFPKRGKNLPFRCVWWVGLPILACGPAPPNYGNRSCWHSPVIVAVAVLPTLLGRAGAKVDSPPCWLIIPTYHVDPLGLFIYYFFAFFLFTCQISIIFIASSKTFMASLKDW